MTLLRSCPTIRKPSWRLSTGEPPRLGNHHRFFPNPKGADIAAGGFSTRIQDLATDCMCLWRSARSELGVDVAADACLDEAQADGTPSQQNTLADQAAERGQAGTTWAGDGQASGDDEIGVNIGAREDRVTHVNPGDIPHADLTDPTHPPSASVMDQTSFGAGVAVGAGGVLLVGAAV